ncbi:abnormal pharyngeal pumping eat-20-like isoform X2 [Hydractinia symbiolongicarpus]|uniref:abnormal pharyngeal pumping eat-20-like isoform X2 n=1 Tax=Hydractinia symbiolongicarpus TaxID=13093 RepID=UPI00254C0EDC|nr:abnormal pharyngeal pumping eat-20-like isoform X2 [Hydractinia symbiolongicarpus]
MIDDILVFTCLRMVHRQIHAASLLLFCFAFIYADIFRENDEDGGPQCKWNPCLNGGMCTAHPDKYYCSCKPGYVGDNCEKRSNCFPNPCHHGTCWPNVEGYTCTCKVGYKGSKCDMLDRCRPNPCENNGICAETLRGVQCECTPGFKGRLCELEAKCEPVNPCMNGGTCREYSDHYHCSCSSGFRGQNCEEFVAPTKPPPTIPLKHEGPQAIPAPDNIPSNVIHELFAVHTADSNGNTETTFHESVGSDVDSNPGVVMVPHLANAGPLPNMESHNPFVGAPTQDSNDKFVFHSGDEDKNKPEEEPKKSKNVSSDSITGNDDRYQTHLVEVSKNKDTKGGVHVGKAIPETSEPISLGNPHPEDDSKADKVLSDAKLHTEKVKQEHTDKVNEINTKVHGTETGSVHSITSSDIHNDIHNTVIENADDTQTIVVKNANLHSEYERPTESGHVRSIVKSIENTNASSSTNSTNFINNEISTNNEPVNNATSSIVGKPLEKPSVVKQTINDIKVNQETKEENDKAINTVNQINKEIQNKASEAKQLAENEAAKVKANARLQAQRINNTPSNIMNNFTQQKSAYIEWRRKALKNYHKRNPDKPLPKNTLTLSKSSLCPEFCRTYCDPWCVGIGCCKTTKDQYAMYRKIEELKKAAAYKALIASKPAPNECDVCNENANCVNKHCICKTGFHGDGVTCSKYKTLCKKCHKNADCIGGDCLCSRGFYGNGRSCWPLPIIK